MVRLNVITRLTTWIVIYQTVRNGDGSRNFICESQSSTLQVQFIDALHQN